MATRPRHVLITGGSRGIGLAIAQLFAKHDYRCTLIGRQEKTLKAALSKLTPLPTPPPSTFTHAPDAPEPISHSYITGDISQNHTFWSSVFQSALPKPQHRGRATASSSVDVLVNCAGLAQSSLFVKIPGHDIESIMQTNLTSLVFGTHFLMTQDYLWRRPLCDVVPEKMITPSIINISSLLGMRGGTGAVVYAASKAGVLGFTRALASEYASHKIRVNAIVPGYVSTDMTKDLQATQLEKRIPLGRFGTPDEIAQAALFLAENEYAHNCVVNLDGGLSAV
ncbi:3-oxoacyl-reductase [Ophiobolus disseminans]|uniref:3-oxoacyl-reductase n=1 Tax=Ophiobolus disseminans TaxID=1469910 RepID=A0A6A7AHJ2_9PLEO|nr:3-oxoacyl-reductase [Ophiobolus disseminans]